MDCNALSNPANGQVSTTGTTFGQTATYSCNTGYNLVGDSTRTCQATGMWSGSAPTCQSMFLFSSVNYQAISTYVSLLPIVADCGALSNPVNGQVTTSGTTFGQTATYSCNTGYNLVGESTRTCQATGNWSGSAPMCECMFVLSNTYHLTYTYMICHSLEKECPWMEHFTSLPNRGVGALSSVFAFNHEI